MAYFSLKRKENSFQWTPDMCHNIRSYFRVALLDRIVEPSIRLNSLYSSSAHSFWSNLLSKNNCLLMWFNLFHNTVDVSHKLNKAFSCSSDGLKRNFHLFVFLASLEYCSLTRSIIMSANRYSLSYLKCLVDFIA